MSIRNLTITLVLLLLQATLLTAETMLNRTCDDALLANDNNNGCVCRESEFKVLGGDGITAAEPMNTFTWNCPVAMCDYDKDPSAPFHPGCNATLSIYTTAENDGLTFNDCKKASICTKDDGKIVKNWDCSNLASSLSTSDEYPSETDLGCTSSAAAAVRFSTGVLGVQLVLLHAVMTVVVGSMLY